MRRIPYLVAGLLGPVAALAQQPAPKDSPFITAVITWLPILALIGLWWLFMRRLNVFGKGGYREYMSVTQERIGRIEEHLADIAASLRKIADSSNDRSS